MIVFVLNMCHTSESWPSKEGVKIGYLNICHAINKKEEMVSILINFGKNFHLFCFSESRLTDHTTDAELHIPGYGNIRLDPKHPKETGLILYYSDLLNIKRISSLEHFGVESIWIEIGLKHSKPIIAGFVYRNPAEHVDWLDKFNLMMEAATLTTKEIIIMGDFNIDLLKTHASWRLIYEQYCLQQVIDIPTRITATSKTLLDHIYVTNKENIIEICSPVCGRSDHNAVCITWAKKGIKIPKIGHKTIQYRCFSKFNEDSFLLDLSQANLQEVYQYTDPDSALEFWLQRFNAVYDRHAPLTTKRVKLTRKPPWLDKEIEKEMHIRDNLLKRKKYEDFKNQRNKVTTLLRKSKKKYFHELAASKKDSKTIWKAINILTNKNAAKTQPVKDISPDTLNTHFVTVADKIITDDKSKSNTLEELKEYCHSKNIHQSLMIPPFKLYEVYHLLRDLKQTGTKGLDGLDGKIIKLSAPVIADSLTYIYNLCLDKSYFPSAFKIAKVIPLYKSGDRSDPSNYRPISLLSVLSKPLEKHINKHIILHIDKYDLLHSSQSGFRGNHSCHTALINLVDHWLSNINNNMLTGVVFIDFAKAFDVIDHRLLLRKLSLYNLSPSVLSLIASFLTNRQQLVSIGTKKSSILNQKFGVPQGSVLGPLFFSLYINDLPLVIKALCELFADDTTVHSSSKNLISLSKVLQENINSLINWTKLNHMALNSRKTKCMMLTTRQKRQLLDINLPSIYVNRDKIEEVDSHKILGITLDNNLTWSNHISLLSKRVAQKIFQLTKIKHFLDLNARKHFFHAHIQSIIDYASTLYDNASENALKPLIRMHKRALKQIILKSTSLSLQDYKKLEILPLHLKLELNKAVTMYKILNGFAPPPLIKRFPQNYKRHTHKLVIDRPRLDLFKSSLHYSGGTLWNRLPPSVKTKKTLGSFKKGLKLYLFDKFIKIPQKSQQHHL